MTQRHAEIIIRVAWIISLVGILAAFLRPYMTQVIDTGHLMNYMSWLFPGQLYFDYFINASLLTFMLFKKSRLGAILLLFVFVSDKLFMLISLHGFDTFYIYTWLAAQFIYALIFIIAIWATFTYRHRITADSPDEGTVAKDLKSLWLGQIALYTAFWAYIGGGLVAVVIIPGLSLIPIVGKATTLLLIAMFYIYMPVACIGSWRSAGNYSGKKIWAVLTRLVILLVLLLIIFNLYSMYLMFSGKSNVAQGTWATTLEARDFDGDIATTEGYYDTVLDITWLADANKASVARIWDSANTWVKDFEISGITGWRLPMERPISVKQHKDVGESVFELSHLYSVTLGNEPKYPGEGITNTGPFLNIQANKYWSSTEIERVGGPSEYHPYTTVVKILDFSFGEMNTLEKNIDRAFVWPVRDGDVGTPISN